MPNRNDMSWNIWDSLKLSIVLGALIGFLLSVYLTIDLLYPLFRDTAGLRSSYAVLASLGIYFCGGIQLSLVGGGAFGVFNFALFFVFLYFPYRFCTRGKEAVDALQADTCTATYNQLGRLLGIRPNHTAERGLQEEQEADPEAGVELSDVEELEEEEAEEEEEEEATAVPPKP